MMKIFPSLCTGCRICEVICSLTHEGSIAPKQSRIRIHSNWPEEEKILLCIACETKKCIEVCPEAALSWNAYLRMNEEKCTGCYLCTDACPYGGIQTGVSKKFPIFCDTCDGEFQCVKWCPTKAVIKVERDEI
jgi:Fe-S-cluster-containing hydrogenase component 2